MATDDAYVSGDVVQVTSEVLARVLVVRVDNTQHVKAGDTLLELDSADAEINVEIAKQELAHTVRQVRQYYATVAASRAQLAERTTTVTKLQGDLQRRLLVQGPFAVSAEEIAHTRDSLSEARATLATAQAQLANAESLTDGLGVRDHPEVKAAAGKLRSAMLALRRTHIVAPIDGVVVERRVQPGQQVASGTVLLSLVPLEDVWIDANFKEIQLEHVAVGQPVSVQADFYGHDVEFQGHVAGFSPGTGSAFAFLPAQNASGNWIKIVQRLPLRIVLDPAQLRQHPLRLGLSAKVVIDLSGERTRVPLRSRAAPALPSALDTEECDKLIEAIVRSNDAGSRREIPG